ncbi:MAG TPA: NAD(P)-dependent oxidoreductase [Flavipsychrobacter sp.]|nr:NAD(P)-dependent oxidoreductase [Flavipsychrobacter sp.]
MDKGKVLIAAPVHEVLTNGLTEAGYELVIAEKISQKAAFDLIKDATGVITSTRLTLNKELLDAASVLKWIGRMGSGMEVIDVPYAESKGIACFSSPEGNCNAVAEHALGMLLSLTKKISSSYLEVKEGKWIRDANRGMELEGKTVGIIGFGHTGSAFAKKLKGFDVNILAYDEEEKPPYAGVTMCTSLAPIFETADIVSFHVPLQKDTFHYLNEEFIRNMKKSFILLNTSRGGVVDTRALYNGLMEKKLMGAALDVVEEEPLESMGPEIKTLLKKMLEMPEILVTPHIAGYSHEALYKMSKALLEKIVTH